jgi:hypothetical protein
MNSPPLRRRARQGAPWAQTLSGIAMSIGVALVVGGAALSTLGFTRSIHQTSNRSEVIATQQVTVRYKVATKESDLYPQGVLGPIDVPSSGSTADRPSAAPSSPTTVSLASKDPRLESLYRSQSESITVDVAWSATPELAGLAGTAQLVAEVSSPDGWSRQLQLSPAQSFNGRVWKGSLTLDVSDTFAKVDRLAALTESVRTVTLTVRAVVDVTANDPDGLTRPIVSSWSPAFDIIVNANVLSPQPLAESRSDIARVSPVSAKRRISLGSWSLAVDVARVIGLSMVGVGLATAIGAWLARRRTRRSTSIDRVLASMIVEVTTPPRTDDAIEVATSRDLIRLGKEVGVVMRSPGPLSVAYLVRLNDQLFVHWPGGRPASTTIVARVTESAHSTSTGPVSANSTPSLVVNEDLSETAVREVESSWRSFVIHDSAPSDLDAVDQSSDTTVLDSDLVHVTNTSAIVNSEAPPAISAESYHADRIEPLADPPELGEYLTVAPPNPEELSSMVGVGQASEPTVTIYLAPPEPGSMVVSQYSPRGPWIALEDRNAFEPGDR